MSPMSGVVMSVPVPERVAELQARFGIARELPGSAADAVIFGRALGEARASVSAPARPAIAPAVDHRPDAGTVVDADGTLADDVPFADLFRAAGAAHGIQPSVLAAVARTESAFDPGAVSPAGAQGLMQFMPATAAEMGVEPLDPASAIDGAARYLAQNLRRFGSLELALAAYNAGPGAVERHGGIPPFAETQAYVPRVLAAAGLGSSPGRSFP